jgi:ribosomal protein L19
MANKKKAYDNFIHELKKTYVNASSKNVKINDISRMVESFNRYKDIVIKENKGLTRKNMNFGLMNYVMESNLEKLFKSNSPLIKEYVSIVKNDKNLSEQYLLFETLSKYNLENESKQYLNEAVSLISSKIDRGGLYDSNIKLYNFLKKNHIVKENIDKEKKEFFSNCDYLIKNKKKLSNLNETTNVLNTVSKYIEKHKNIITEVKKTSMENAINEYNMKYSNVLNEEDKKIIQELFNSPQKKLANKETLFNKLREACVSSVNKMLENVGAAEKEGLLSIKEGLLNMKFQEATLVEDITKLLEMRDVLSDEKNTEL